jgi:hypothetical protein
MVLALTPFLRFNSKPKNTHHCCIVTACMFLTFVGDWESLQWSRMKLDVAATSKQRSFWQNRDARLASITARHSELGRATPVAACVEFLSVALSQILGELFLTFS